MADGELQFNTKIDTKGFENGVDDIKKKGKNATVISKALYQWELSPKPSALTSG